MFRNLQTTLYIFYGLLKPILKICGLQETHRTLANKATGFCTYHNHCVLERPELHLLFVLLKAIRQMFLMPRHPFLFLQNFKDPKSAGAAKIWVPQVSRHPLNFDNGYQAPLHNKFPTRFHFVNY